LLQHIEKLRMAAPLTPAARDAAATLPTFGLSGIHAEAIRRAQSSIEALLRARTWRDDLAQSARSHGAHAMVAAARMLADVAWLSGADVERASRLHRFLGETSGCRDITWIATPSSEPQKQGRANRHLGPLWVWFTNEFVHTERTWTTFVELMQRR
jgi:hypothetical protein